MNDNTRRQWDLYQEREVPCPDCAWMLLYLVADHNATSGVTRPGWQRLIDRTRRSRSWVAAHLAHLERDGHIVLASTGRWRGRRAAEYELPWLHNEPVDSRQPSVRNQTATRTTTRTTSSSFQEERRSAPRKTGAPAAAPSAGDATNPDWCPVCEEVVPDGTPCRCPGGGCEELTTCRVGTRRRLWAVPS